MMFEREEEAARMCPLLSAQAGTEKACMEEKCVWWNKEIKNCAIALLAYLPKRS